MDQEQKNQIRDEDEINLMDYLKTILKRKWLILSIFLLAVISAGVFSFISAKVYEIDTLFEIGGVRTEVEGETRWSAVESPSLIIEKIEGDVYGILVREELGIPIKEYPEIKTENLEGTMLIRMTIESPDIQKAKSILSKINILILEEHQEEIGVKRELIEKNIRTTEERIKLVESDIEKTRSKIEFVNSDIEKVRNKIKPLKDSIERVEDKIVLSGEKRKNLEEQVRVLEEVLIFEQTPGTQFALLNTRGRLLDKAREIEDLYLRINSLKIQIENLNLRINSLERAKKDHGSHINSLERTKRVHGSHIISLKVNIERFKAQINSLKASLHNIGPTKVLRIPTASETPIGPRPLLNIAIAGILGLFMGTFLVFGKEWYIQSK